MLGARGEVCECEGEGEVARCMLLLQKRMMGERVKSEYKEDEKTRKSEKMMHERDRRKDRCWREKHN